VHGGGSIGDSRAIAIRAFGDVFGGADGPTRVELPFGMEVAVAKSQVAPNQNTQMGFSTVALILFLPLLISVLAVFSIALLSIYQRTATDRLCKVDVLRLQSELGTILRDLLRLNRSAHALRIARARADAGLAAAIDSAIPIAIAAAKAQQSAVIVRQTALAVRQKELLAQAAMARLSADRRLLAERGHFGLGTVRPRWSSSSTLAVHAEPPDSLTPNYVPDDLFRERQSHTYDYRYDVFDRVPNWLQRFLVAQEMGGRMRSVPAKCSASLKEQEGKWVAVLNKAKP
jgi:hypothetical protein